MAYTDALNNKTAGAQLQMEVYIGKRESSALVKYADGERGDKLITFDWFACSLDSGGATTKKRAAQIAKLIMNRQKDRFID